MKMVEKIIIFFIVIGIISFASYNFVLNQKVSSFLDDRNRMCSIITNSLKEQVSENSTCIDYYCYYAPYSPPAGNLSNLTTTLCVCDCKMADGSIKAIQILSTLPTTNQSLDFLKAS